VLTGAMILVMVVVGIFPRHLIELTRAAAQMLN
jgi:hypothetical protein